MDENPPQVPVQRAEGRLPRGVRGSELANLQDMLPIFPVLHGPNPGVLAASGGAMIAIGVFLAPTSLWWQVPIWVVLGMYIMLVANVRSADPCDNIEIARREARNHMARFTAWLDDFAACFPSGEGGGAWPGWREADKDSAIEFARYVVRETTGNIDAYHTFHDQRRALEEFFGCCHSKYVQRRRWFLRWYGDHARDGWWAPILRMVVMMKYALAERDGRGVRRRPFIAFYEAIERGEVPASGEGDGASCADR